MSPKKKKVKIQQPIPPKAPRAKPIPEVKYSWLERVLNEKLKKKGKESTIFPLALAQLGIAPNRAETLIKWQVKRMNFKPERMESITKNLINVYRHERKWLVAKKQY